MTAFQSVLTHLVAGVNLEFVSDRNLFVNWTTEPSLASWKNLRIKSYDIICVWQRKVEKDIFLSSSVDNDHVAEVSDI